MKYGKPLLTVIKSNDKFLFRIRISGGIKDWTYSINRVDPNDTWIIRLDFFLFSRTHFISLSLKGFKYFPAITLFAIDFDWSFSPPLFQPLIQLVSLFCYSFTSVLVELSFSFFLSSSSSSLRLSYHYLLSPSSSPWLMQYP